MQTGSIWRECGFPLACSRMRTAMGQRHRGFSSIQSKHDAQVEILRRFPRSSGKRLAQVGSLLFLLASLGAHG